MLPKFSIELSRRTITPCAAISRAPRARVTLMMAGRSSGEIPTASAMAKSSASTCGRSRKTLAAKTTRTRSRMTRVSR
jgi:hypothetical protein